MNKPNFIKISDTWYRHASGAAFVRLMEKHRFSKAKWFVFNRVNGESIGNEHGYENFNIACSVANEFAKGI